MLKKKINLLQIWKSKCLPHYNFEQPQGGMGFMIMGHENMTNHLSTISLIIYILENCNLILIPKDKAYVPTDSQQQFQYYHQFHYYHQQRKGKLEGY